MSSGSEEDFSSKDFDPLKLLYARGEHDIMILIDENEYGNHMFPDSNKPKPADVCLFDNLASLEGYFKRTGENLEEKFDKTVRKETLFRSPA